LVWLKLHIGGELLSENLALFARPKHIVLRDPHITMQLDQVNYDTVQLTLSAEQPALWVWIETTEDALRFSDNFFHLHPRREQFITVKLDRDSGDTLSILDKIKIHSLFDTYQPTG
jgi:hypothetical protein